MRRVLILGGGFGGLTVAAELADRRPADTEVVLVEQRPSYLMGLAKLWALDGRRPLDAGRHAYDSLARRGVRFVRGVVRAIDPQRRTVDVDGAPLAYDRLVIALGADVAPEKLPGFTPKMNLYAESGIEPLRTQLGALRGGSVVLMISSMPFKCPPAPYEAMLLVDAMLRRQGVRDKAKLVLTTPEPHPLPVAPPEYGARLKELLAQKGIEYWPLHTPTAVDWAAHEVRFQDGSSVRFDVLLGVPPHRAPAVVRDSGLTDDSGWIPVDPATLKTRHEDVWAVGDVVAIRLANGKVLPKAGTLAQGQAVVVAEQVAATLEGRTATARFDGRGVCFIEVGGGKAIAAVGSFYRTPQPTLEFRAADETGLREKERFEADLVRRWFG